MPKNDQLINLSWLQTDGSWWLLIFRPCFTETSTRCNAKNYRRLFVVDVVLDDSGGCFFEGKWKQCNKTQFRLDEIEMMEVFRTGWNFHNMFNLVISSLCNACMPGKQWIFVVLYESCLNDRFWLRQKFVGRIIKLWIEGAIHLSTISPSIYLPIYFSMFLSFIYTFLSFFISMHPFG